jgi:hypothetical protein
MEKPKCLICTERDVYDIKSHLTPKAISENTYGGKDKEEIYSITPKTGEHDVFRGREHPNAKPGEIKPQPNVAKGIFCKQCETALGKIESFCQPPLLKAVGDLSAGKLKIENQESIKLFRLNVPSNVLDLFLYTVVWRQSLEQEMSGGDNPLSKQEFEHLRNIINSQIHNSIDEIATDNDFAQFPSVLLVTTYHHGEYNGFNNPFPYVTNPEVFMISEYLCLYWKNPITSKDIEELTLLPESLHFPPKFLKSSSQDSLIAVLNEKPYTNIQSRFMEKSAHDYRLTHIKRVAMVRGMTLYDAAILLEVTTRQIAGNNPTPEHYHESFLIASEKLSQRTS